jgi:hypothetical protein
MGFCANEGASGQAHPDRERKSGKLAGAATVLRAATAIVVFGIPLLAGAAAIIGYGAHAVYKRITRP